MRKTIVIYHGNCADGFGAATIARRALGTDNVEYIAGIYGNPPPDVTDAAVILLDFSYKRPVILEMAEKAFSILILDHHRSAIADLVDLPNNVIAHLDESHSGAMIAWEYYFPHLPAPRMVEHIQDRDLWQFKLEGTREIQSALFSHPYDFDTWEKLLKSDIEELRLDGEAIWRKHMKDVRELIDTHATRMEIGGHDVPVLNAPYFYVSEAAHIMCAGEPFAACYWDTPTQRVFGLRSDENGRDVSKIAELYGGGGHKHSAGFQAVLPAYSVAESLVGLEATA